MQEHDDLHQDEIAHGVDEVDLLKWPDPLPARWTLTGAAENAVDTIYTVFEAGSPRGTVEVAPVRNSKYKATYPIGSRDRLLSVSDDAAAAAVQLVSEHVLAADSRCKRLVIACAEGDLAAIDRAEAAGYRYVVDVDLPDGSASLMTAEPARVLEQSRRIDTVPTS